jgi:hypothetical protein
MAVRVSIKTLPKGNWLIFKSDGRTAKKQCKP